MEGKTNLCGVEVVFREFLQKQSNLKLFQFNAIASLCGFKCTNEIRKWNEGIDYFRLSQLDKIANLSPKKNTFWVIKEKLILSILSSSTSIEGLQWKQNILDCLSEECTVANTTKRKRTEFYYEVSSNDEDDMEWIPEHEEIDTNITHCHQSFDNEFNTDSDTDIDIDPTIEPSVANENIDQDIIKKVIADSISFP